MKRRNLLFAALGIGSAAAVAHWWPDEGLWNPCRPLPLPPEIANHEIVQAAWTGLDPFRVWDSHVHLFETGDAGTRAGLTPAMHSLVHPFEFLHTLFYANAACLDGYGDVADKAYVARLAALLEGMAPGVRLMLLAMDYFHDESGNRVPARTVFQVPDAYAAGLAANHPGRFEWIASIHPYRRDCVAALEWAKSHGARAVKWIPSTMGIDPASPLCDRLYEGMLRLDMPLLTHGGYEHPLLGSGAMEELNSPLALRRPLEHGVRIIVAHCASTGTSIDTDAGAHGPQIENFELFKRLMDESRYRGRLYGDIAALTEASRVGPLLRYVLRRTDWHDRLLNGSDYPLPGYMPGVSVKLLMEEQFITKTEGRVLREIRTYNPLLFDFVLKRRLTTDGIRFPASVFETAGFFRGTA